jgi:hypothetical protein
MQRSPGSKTEMHRFALLSDIHGNLPALEGVLADIERSGVASVHCLGDLVGYGPDPSGVVSRVRGLGIPVIRGNYDDGVGRRNGSCGCYYATEQAKQDGAASSRPRGSGSFWHTVALARSTSTCFRIAATPNSCAWQRRPRLTWCASGMSTFHTIER